VKATQFQLLPLAQRVFPGSIRDIQDRESEGKPIPKPVVRK
jgi:hypothetical protein